MKKYIAIKSSRIEKYNIGNVICKRRRSKIITIDQYVWKSYYTITKINLQCYLGVLDDYMITHIYINQIDIINEIIRETECNKELILKYIILNCSNYLEIFKHLENDGIIFSLDDYPSYTNEHDIHNIFRKLASDMNLSNREYVELCLEKKYTNFVCGIQEFYSELTEIFEEQVIRNKDLTRLEEFIYMYDTYDRMFYSIINNKPENDEYTIKLIESILKIFNETMRPMHRNLTIDIEILKFISNYVKIYQYYSLLFNLSQKELDNIFKSIDLTDENYLMIIFKYEKYCVSKLKPIFFSLNKIGYDFGYFINKIKTPFKIDVEYCRLFVRYLDTDEWDYIRFFSTFKINNQFVEWLKKSDIDLTKDKFGMDFYKYFRHEIKLRNFIQILSQDKKIKNLFFIWQSIPDDVREEYVFDSYQYDDLDFSDITLESLLEVKDIFYLKNNIPAKQFEKIGIDSLKIKLSDYC